MGMQLQRFLRPMSRVIVTDDMEIRFTIDQDGKALELQVTALEYLIADQAWYVRLKEPKNGKG